MLLTKQASINSSHQEERKDTKQPEKVWHPLQWRVLHSYRWGGVGDIASERLWTRGAEPPPVQPTAPREGERLFANIDI